MSIEKFNRLARKSLLIAAWVVPGALFIVILSSAISNHRSYLCSRVNISIDENKGVFFLDKKDVEGMVTDYCGNTLTGVPVSKQDMSSLEENIEANPFVHNAELYSNIKGVVNVEIEQKEPLIRVVNKEGVSYYIDRFGEKIPPSAKFTPRLVVATGYLDDMKGKSVFTGNPVLKKLYDLALFIDKDEFWKAQFEQIYVTEKKEFELIPMLGNHVVQIGKAEDLNEKFWKLNIFYKEVLKNVDGDDYKAINLKFKDQIVCTKI